MPDAPIYREGPQPGRPLAVPNPLNNSEGPRARGPLSAWTGGATEKDQPKRPSGCQLQEAWEKTLIGPQLLRRRRSVSLNNWRRQGPCSQAAAPPSRSALAGKKVLRRWAQGHFGPDSLWPCRLWPARLVCQRAGEHWSTLAKTGCRIFLEHCISYHPRHQPPGAPGAARNPATQAAAPPPRLPSRGKPRPSRAASGANPRGRPTCRGGNKTTSETQGQCG